MQIATGSGVVKLMGELINKFKFCIKDDNINNFKDLDIDYETVTLWDR